VGRALVLVVVEGITQPLGRWTKGGVEAKAGEAHQHSQNHQTKAESWGKGRNLAHSITGCKGCRGQPRLRV